MAIPLYLALTAGEFGALGAKPEKMAWMACHFSPYGRGLSNLPEGLPEGSMIILNDRTPVCGHDPEVIAEQLKDAVTRNGAEAVLLDFQRPGYGELDGIAQAVVRALPCPVGVTEEYGKGLPCPVFLPPPPPDQPLEAFLAPHKGREVWLDAALSQMCLRLTEDGCGVLRDHPGEAALSFTDDGLHCHYAIRREKDAVRVFLKRTKDDLEGMLEAAEGLGVTRAVGLWQELG